MQDEKTPLHFSIITITLRVKSLQPHFKHFIVNETAAQGCAWSGRQNQSQHREGGTYKQQWEPQVPVCVEGLLAAPRALTFLSVSWWHHHLCVPLCPHSPDLPLTRLPPATEGQAMKTVGAALASSWSGL